MLRPPSLGYGSLPMEVCPRKAHFRTDLGSHWTTARSETLCHHHSIGEELRSPSMLGRIHNSCMHRPRRKAETRQSAAVS